LLLSRYSAGAVILCAYAEQGDKPEIAEKLVSAAAEFPVRQLGWRQRKAL